MLKNKKRISIELTTVIIISIINVCVCKNYYSNICSLRTFYIQFTSIFTLFCVFIDSSTMFSVDLWPLTGRVICSSCDWLVSSATYSTDATPWGPKHRLTLTSHTQPLGGRQGDPAGRVRGMLKNLNPMEWRGRCAAFARWRLAPARRATMWSAAAVFFFFNYYSGLYSFLVCAEMDICDAYRAHPS